MRFEKTIIVTIRDDEIVDAEYLQKVKNKEIKQDVPYFDMLDEIEFSNLIKYMKENNYVIVPNQYTLNQAWKFEDGMFILNSGV